MSKTNEKILKLVMNKLFNVLKYIGDKPFLCVDKYTGDIHIHICTIFLSVYR